MQRRTALHYIPGDAGNRRGNEWDIYTPKSEAHTSEKAQPAPGSLGNLLGDRGKKNVRRTLNGGGGLCAVVRKRGGEEVILRGDGAGKIN